ncbi:MAG: hypothetical protein ACHBNF_14410 [Chromatiales bacterium]
MIALTSTLKYEKVHWKLYQSKVNGRVAGNVLRPPYVGVPGGGDALE